MWNDHPGAAFDFGTFNGFTVAVSRRLLSQGLVLLNDIVVLFFK